MQIDAIELFHVALPLTRPRQTSYGPIQQLETVLAAVHSGETVGWGEASPGNAPAGSAEWAAGAFACLRDWLAPAIRGSWVETCQAIQERWSHFRGNQFAKSALDAAWWDLAARRQKKPLYELLGGENTAVEIGATFDEMETFEKFLGAIRQAFGDGFARVKLIMRPGWDLQMLNIVRQEFPTETIHVDFHAQLTLDHMEMLYRLDDFDLAMVEQPLAPEDLVGHAMIQDAIRTPVGLSQSITGTHVADMALELKSCEFVNVLPGRVGGLTPAVAIHDLCRDHENKAPCFLGAVPQTAIGAWAAVALATKSNFTYPADYFRAEEWLACDLADSPKPARDDAESNLALRPLAEPGIGVVPDREVLQKYTLAKAEV